MPVIISLGWDARRHISRSMGGKTGIIQGDRIMDSRVFLRSAFMVASSSTAFAVMTPRASKAAGLMDMLANPTGSMPADAADMPAENAHEAQYYDGRWGGWRRRCWWRWNRWGGRVRVCAW